MRDSGGWRYAKLNGLTTLRSLPPNLAKSRAVGATIDAMHARPDVRLYCQARWRGIRFPPMTLPEDPNTLQALLTELQSEHLALDEAIARLEETPSCDELRLRRLKKSKLQLKDRIAAIQRMLGPDLLA